MLLLDRKKWSRSKPQQWRHLWIWSTQTCRPSVSDQTEGTNHWCSTCADLIFVSWFLPSTCLFSLSSHTLSSCCSLSFSISLLSTLSLTKQREEWQLHKSKKLTITNSKWKWCYPLSIPNITDIKASLKIGFTMSNYTFFTLVTITTKKLKLFGLFFFRKDIDIFNNSLK